MLVEVFLDVNDAVVLELLVVGEDLGNDNFLIGVLLALARVNNYLENAADARDLGLDFLGIYVLTVREDDEVLLTARDVEPA